MNIYIPIYGILCLICGSMIFDAAPVNLTLVGVAAAIAVGGFFVSAITGFVSVWARRQWRREHAAY